MAWEAVDPNNTHQESEDPQVSIYSNGTGRVNSAAIGEFFEEGQRIGFRQDRDRGRIGIVPDPGDDEYTVAISRNGGEVFFKNVLDVAGVDIDALAGTYHIPLQEDDASGLLVFDVSDLPGVATPGEPAEPVEDGPDSDQDAEYEGPYWCGRCGYESESAIGVRRHNGHSHDDDAIVLEEEPTDEDLVQDSGDPDSPGDDVAEEDKGDDSPLADDDSGHKYDTGGVDLTAESDDETVTIEAPSNPIAPPGGTRQHQLRGIAQHYDTIEAVADDLGVEDRRAVKILASHGLHDQVDLGHFEVVFDE